MYNRVTWERLYHFTLEIKSENGTMAAYLTIKNKYILATTGDYHTDLQKFKGIPVLYKTVNDIYINFSNASGNYHFFYLSYWGGRCLSLWIIPSD